VGVRGERLTIIVFPLYHGADGRAIYQSKGWQQASRWPFIEDNEQHRWAQKEQPQTTRPVDKQEGVIGEGDVMLVKSV
jgi:hypothetical protein